MQFHQNQLVYELPGGVRLRLLLGVGGTALVNAPAEPLTQRAIERILTQANEEEEPLLSIYDLHQLEFRRATRSFQPDLHANNHRYRPAAVSVEYLFVQIVDRLFYGYCPLTDDAWTATTEAELGEVFEKRLHERFPRRSNFPRDTWFRMTAPVLKSVERTAIDVDLDATDADDDAPTPEDPLEALTQASADPPAPAFREAKLVQELSDLLRDPGRASVLLVGPPGVGKTLLARSVGARWQKRGAKQRLFSIDPVQLMERLSADHFTWHGGMRHLTHQLTHAPSPHVLHVHAWSDLMLTGETVGSNATLGSGLERLILEGNLQVVAEATAEQVGKMASRFPRFSQLFTQLRVPAPERDVLTELLGTLPLTTAAARTLIGLLHRFEPYGGMPGVAVRFVERMLETRPDPGAPIDEAELRRAYQHRSGLPDWIVHPERTVAATTLHRVLSERVFGQERAVGVAVDALKRLKTNLAPAGRPVANFLFMGPTGVGKTELARQIARQIFGDPDRLLRFDLSEYALPGSEQRLYSGQGNGRLLTDPVRLQPFRVLLFDELEKADRSFHNLLLQILDSGRLTDDRDRTVSFAGCVIVMTSNIGHGPNQRTTIRLGGGGTDPTTEARQHYERALRAALPAEIVARMEHLVVFDALDAPTIRRIVDYELERIRQLPGLRERPFELTLTDAARNWLGTRGYDARYGARYLQRTLRTELLIPLANALDGQADASAAHVDVAATADRLQFSVQAPDSLASMMDLMRQREEQITLDELAQLHRGLMEFSDSAVGRQLREELRAGAAQQPPDPRWVKRRVQLKRVFDEAQELRTAVHRTEEAYFQQRLRGEPLHPDPAERYAALRQQRAAWKRRQYRVLNAGQIDSVEFRLLGRAAERAFAFLEELALAAGLDLVRTAYSYLPFGSQNWAIRPEELAAQTDTFPRELARVPNDRALLGYTAVLRGPFARLFLHLLIESETRLYFRDAGGWSWADFGTAERDENPYTPPETPEQQRWRVVHGAYFQPQFESPRELQDADTTDEDFFERLAKFIQSRMDDRIQNA